MLKDVSRCTDQALIAKLQQLVRADRTLSVRLLVHLGEMDARRLYREQAYASMFEYSVRALHMSEAEAYLRIQAARLGRQFPLVLELLGSGAVHLTAVKLLSPHLTADNHVQLLERARGKSKRELELLVAEIAPKPDVPSRMCRLPQSNGPRAPQSVDVTAQRASAAAPVSTASESSLGVLPPAEVPSAAAAGGVQCALPSPRPPRAVCAPLSPSRYKLQLTLGQDAHDKLEQLTDLLRHRVPAGDLACIVELAFDALLDKTMKQRWAQTAASKKSRVCVDSTVDQVAASENLRARKARLLSRYVPRAVVRAVHERDGGQCTFVSAQGRRCTARGFLELHHHDTPFARGGQATAENLRLICRAHNALFAERDFGRGFMLRKLRQVRAVRTVCTTAAPLSQQALECRAGGPHSVQNEQCVVGAKSLTPSAVDERYGDEMCPT